MVPRGGSEWSGRVHTWYVAGRVEAAERSISVGVGVGNEWAGLSSTCLVERSRVYMRRGLGTSSWANGSHRTSSSDRRRGCGAWGTSE